MMNDCNNRKINRKGTSKEHSLLEPEGPKVSSIRSCTASIVL
jgi:hypothetical protein